MFFVYIFIHISANMSPFRLKFSQMILHTETSKLMYMYNWSFLFVVLHKPTLFPSTFKTQVNHNSFQQYVLFERPTKLFYILLQVDTRWRHSMRYPRVPHGAPFENPGSAPEKDYMSSLILWLTQSLQWWQSSPAGADLSGRPSQL